MVKDTSKNTLNIPKKPWYKEIKEELDRRDAKCASRDPNDMYKRPDKDPYSYGSLEAFVKRHEFKPRSDCKYVPPNGASLLKDPYGRLFRNIRSQKQCQLVNGKWSPKSVNRSYRYERGQCWKNDDHLHCSQYEDARLLRPGHESLPNQKEIIEKGAEKCNADPRCTWAKFKNSYDCISSTFDGALKRRITSPPNEMPANITKGNDSKIEEFLSDLYKRKRIKSAQGYKDITPPATQSLQGEGNRCVPPAPPKPKSPSTASTSNSRITDPDADKEIDIYGFTIKKRKERLKIPNAEEPLDDGALNPATQGMVPSIPQSVINMIMKNFANKELNGEKVTSRGLLAWHSTGSGKTFTAAGVMDAFWISKRDIIFVSSLDALASNPPSNFQEGLLNLYPDFQKAPFEGATRQESLQNIANAFDKRGVRFLSFAKMSNRVKKTMDSGVLNKQSGGAKKSAQSSKSSSGKLSKDDFIDLNNTVIIVDEVHNLFRPLPHQKAQHDYLKKQLLDPRKFPGLKMVILSATPGDNIEDVLVLLNMIRDPTNPPIVAPDISSAQSLDAFRNSIRGLVSYFDMSSDFTRFPLVKENDPIYAPMDPVQFSKYVEAYLKTQKEGKVTNFAKLAQDHQVAKYWAPARKYSNMMFTFEKGMKATEFSSKLPALLSNIKAYSNEKHYAYSAFFDNRNKGWSSQGILAIANMMEQALQYRKFSLDEAKFESIKDFRGKVSGYKIAKLPDKRKRFMVVTLKELGGDSGGKVTGAAGERLKKMLAVYNHPENRYGEIIHVMLASNAFNEGLDLKSVRHIHFFEPLVTMASDKQTVGRAARFCSHADLNKESGEWTVNIHRYMSAYPTNIEFNSKKNSAQIVQGTDGPTKDESEQINRYERQIRDLNNTIENVTRQLEPLKNITAKSKDEDAKVRKEDLKLTLQGAKNEIKALTVQIKEINTSIAARAKDQKATEAASRKKRKGSKLQSIDKDKIKMIDGVIFEESRERVKELMTVYQCMKEAAVDCRLMQEFHEKSGNKYTCVGQTPAAAHAAYARAKTPQSPKFWSDL